MPNKQSNSEQEPQADSGSLSEERKVRGEVRNAYLDAGRAQAESANAEARARSETGPQPVAESESSPDNGDTEYAAEHEARQNAREEALKVEARSRYEGSDESFEQEWPGILEQLLRDDMQRSQESIRRRL